MADDKILTKATEELMAASLPELIEGLGLAVAKANKALMEPHSDVLFTLPSAEIELSVALSLSKQTEGKIGLSGGGAFGVFAFNVNASYASTYGYKAEAASKIHLTLMAKPREIAAPATATAGA